MFGVVQVHQQVLTVQVLFPGSSIIVEMDGITEDLQRKALEESVRMCLREMQSLEILSFSRGPTTQAEQAMLVFMWEME